MHSPSQVIRDVEITHSIRKLSTQSTPGTHTSRILRARGECILSWLVAHCRGRPESSLVWYVLSRNDFSNRGVRYIARVQTLSILLRPTRFQEIENRILRVLEAFYVNVDKKCLLQVNAIAIRCIID